MHGELVPGAHVRMGIDNFDFLSVDSNHPSSWRWLVQNVQTPTYVLPRGAIEQ
jgi:hypothetical protein